MRVFRSCGLLAALVFASDGCAEEASPPVVAAGGAGGSVAGAGAGGADQRVGFLGACTSDEQCTTGLCHTFPSKGRLCSKPCDDANACEAPSPGCNGMGVCRAP